MHLPNSHIPMNRRHSQFADVSLGIGANKCFTYAVPQHLTEEVAVGKRVIVELRSRQRVGVVMRLVSHCSLSSVKEIISVVDSVPILSRRMLKLVEWVASYYVAPLGTVVDAAIPHGLGDLEAKGRCGEAGAVGRKGRRPLDILSSLPADLWVDAEMQDLELTDGQEDALSRIIAATDARDARPLLLHGVTGSGKTEVFLRATEYVLKKGKRALILVPEISLTPALLSLFGNRFGDRAGIFHSKLTPAQRRDQWERAYHGELDVIIGVRSAVFAPLRRLGLIVVDEEHEATYKQDSAPFFNARDVALVSGCLFKCPVVLCGATPSLGTFHNACREKYQYIFLSERVDSRPLANVSVIDMRPEASPRSVKLWGPAILSSKARDAVGETLAAGEQVLLFVNRRGFSPFLTCGRCGHVFRCDHCDITLTYHSTRSSIICHLCGAIRPLPKLCDACRSDEIRFIGFGTEKVQEEAARLFPDANILRMDSDAISTRRKYERALSSITRGEVDVIVGTQIVAKGHNFPHLTLVVVVLADTILNLPDFRAAERTFQLLTQVSGRPGRHGRQGTVLLQTYSPEHYAIKAAAAQDYASFYEQEMKFRTRLGLPPLTRLASVLVSGKDYKWTLRAAESVGDVLRAGRSDNIHVLGPAEAPIAKLKDRYRFQAFVRSYSSQRLHGFLLDRLKALEKVKIGPSDIRIAVNVDPSSML
ncbi:MAG: primosomal protein N' [Candidatus Coatesbacteria bacterium]|nr:primosomal protein N' [Candidatus Coatesbacteria bacterium]